MPKLPDLEAWAIFARLAQTASFTETAKELGLSKASVSKTIARLEAQLGTTLLMRTSRRLALTEVGRSAAARAGQMLADAQAINADIMAQSTEPMGLVRMTAPMSFGIAYLAPFLPELMRTHPQVAVDLQLTDEILDLIGEGFDLALRIAALPDSALRVRRLCEVRRLLVGSPAYFARHGRPTHPRELSAHACLGYTYLATSDRWRFIHVGGGEVIVAPRYDLRINNADALGPALLAGVGLALQPEFLVWRELGAGRLEAVMPDWSAPPIALNIVTPPGRLRPARVNAVIEFLVARLATAPWAIPVRSESKQ